MRFIVEIYEPETDDWRELGSVLLPLLAPEHEVEGALAPLGVYCPRGADALEWSLNGKNLPLPGDSAMIYDADGAPMVRLIACPTLRGMSGAVEA